MQTPPLYTYRTFVYRWRDSIDDFFEESPLWESLYYDFYLPLRDKWFFEDTIVHTSASIFNEAYALIVQALVDGHPEEGFKARYAQNVRSRLGDEADLCWALVYALTLKTFVEHKARRVFGLLSKFVSEELGYRLQDVSELLRTISTHSIDFAPNPERPDRLPKNYSWWMNVTEAFDPERIDVIMSQWSEKADRERVFLHVVEQRATAQMEGEKVAKWPSDNYVDTYRRFVRGKAAPTKAANPQPILAPKENGRLNEDIERLAEENTRLKKEIERLAEKNKLLMTEIEMLKGEKDRLKEEIELLMEENTNLNKGVDRLEEANACLNTRVAEHDAVQRLPLADFLTHVEQHFTPWQNAEALAVKDVLFALYTHPTDEERLRLNKLGHMPRPVGGINVNGPLNDIHHNEQVKAGL